MNSRHASSSLLPRPTPWRALRAAAVLVLAAATSAQKFEYDHGKAAVTEIGTALVHVPTGYVAVGTAGNAGLGLGVNLLGSTKLFDAGATTPNSNIEPHCLRRTASGGYIVSGEVPGNPAGEQVFLALFNAAGVSATGGVFPTYRGDATGIRKGTRVIEIAGGGFAVIANVSQGMTQRGVLTVTAANLALPWTRTYGLSGSPIQFHDLRQDANGEFVIVGTMQQGATAALRSTLVLRTSVLGIPICAAVFGALPAITDVEQQAITATKDGGFAIWGHYGPASMTAGSFLLKVEGQCFGLVWHTQFPAIAASRPTIAEYPDGNLLCNGCFGDDALLLRTTAAGVKNAVQTYSAAGALADEIFQAVPTPDGGFAAVGSTQWLDGAHDVYLLKGDSSLRTCRSTEPTIEQISPELPASLRQIPSLADPFDGAIPVTIAGPLTESTKRCSDPPSIKAPDGLDSWFTFDDLSGNISRNVFSMVGAPDGLDTNGPSRVPGKVAGALSFDGTDDQVVVPHHAAVDIGAGDFTIASWIRVPPTLGMGTRTIVDKRTVVGSQQTGYTFFLNHASAGFQLGLLLANGTNVSYVSPTLPIVGGQWHFVAVRVERGAASHFVLDGASHAFMPVNPGSLANPAPLRIGSLGPSRHFLGDLDELDLYGRALSLDELDSIRIADSKGKCKEAGFLPTELAFCRNQNTVTATAWVYNVTNRPQSYTAWFQGLPGGVGCTIQGPTGFTPASPIDVGVVLPWQRKSFTVNIARPVGMTAANLAGCYQMMVQSSSGLTFSCEGAVRDRRDLCVTGSGWDSTATALRVGRPLQLGPVRVSNTTAAPIALNYRFVARNDDLTLDTRVLRLNGLAPGVQPTGSAVLLPGGFADINVTAEFVATDGLGAYTVRLEADTDNDGAPDFLGGRVLTNSLGDGIPPTYTGVGAPTTVGIPTLATGGRALVGGSLVIVAEGLVPNSVSVLGLSAALANQPFPLALIGGQPNAFLYLDPTVLLTFVVVADAQGAATLTLPVPNDPGLSGAVLHWQIFNHDPALPYAFAFGNSNAMSVTIE